MMHTMERYFTPTDTDTILTDRIAEGLMISVRDAAQVAVKILKTMKPGLLSCGPEAFPITV